MCYYIQNIFGAPLYLHIAEFFLFLCAVLGTPGLPDHFEGSVGAVFTSFQGYVTIYCHRHATVNKVKLSNKIDKYNCNKFSLRISMIFVLLIFEL